MTARWRPLARELTLAGRSTVLGSAASAHLLVLAAFVWCWGSTGLPWPGTNLLDQTLAVQFVTLAVLVPWAATRWLTNRDRDRLVWLAAITDTRPADLLIAKCLSAFTIALLVIVAGLPLVILAQQMAAAPLRDVLRGEVPLVAYAWLATSVAGALRLSHQRPVVLWIGGTIACAGISAVVHRWLPHAAAAYALAAFGVAAVLWLYGRADRAFRYLEEHA